MVEEKLPEGPKVLITLPAFNKLEFYIDAAPEEISGYGTSELTGDNEITVTDIFTFEQESSAAGTDINPEELAKGIIELIGNGIDPEKMTVWWHSHVRMHASFSGTDTNTMDTNPNFKDARFFTSIVGNKQGDYGVRVDQYHPLRFKYDKIKLLVTGTDAESLICASSWCKNLVATLDGKVLDYCLDHQALHSAITDEVKAKVSKPLPKVVYATKGGPYTGHGGYVGNKSCGVPSCWRRIPQNEKFCHEHEPEIEKKLERGHVAALKEGKKDSSYLDLLMSGELNAAAFVPCDISGCIISVNVGEGFVGAGMVLCPDHLESFEDFEHLYGKLGIDVDSEIALEVLEYFLGTKSEATLSKEAEDILDGDKMQHAFSDIPEEVTVVTKKE